MVYSIYLYIMTTIVFLSTSCLDEISIELPDSSMRRLTIGGVVERSPDEYRFFISVHKTQSVNQTFIEDPEYAKIAIVYHGEPIFSVENGKEMRISIENFHTEYGGDKATAEFNFTVELDNGSVFKSEPQRILEVPKGTEIGLEYFEKKVVNSIGNIVEKGFVRVSVDAPLINEMGSVVSLKWDVTGDYEFREACDAGNFNARICYLHEENPVGLVNILNAGNISSTSVKNYELGSTEANYKFASRYYFTLVQKAVVEETAVYWEEVAQSLTRAGTIYDAYPGPVSTNIQQVKGEPVEVIGYFYTAGVDTLRRRATKEETGFQRSPCSIFSRAEGCCGCLLLPGSNDRKPNFWE